MVFSKRGEGASLKIISKVSALLPWILIAPAQGVTLFVILWPSFPPEQKAQAYTVVLAVVGAVGLIARRFK